MNNDIDKQLLQLREAESRANSKVQRTLAIRKVLEQSWDIILANIGPDRLEKRSSDTFPAGRIR
jgi:hypothetical protein